MRGWVMCVGGEFVKTLVCLSVILATIFHVFCPFLFFLYKLCMGDFQRIDPIFSVINI